MRSERKRKRIERKEQRAGAVARCRTFFLLPLAFVLCALLIACAGHTGRPQPAGFRTDRCPDRLHALSGQLLLHYAAHGALPAAMHALSDDPGMLECPASGLGYVYDPAGVPMDDGRLLVLYDAAPVHDGRRWGVAINRPQLFEPVTAKVVPVPEHVLSPQP